MKHIFIAVICMTSILLTQESCQRIDTTDLGIGLIPAVDNVNTFDTTLEVITSTFFLDDSSSVSRTEDHAWGFMVDPEFGSTSAGIYFDVQPAASGTYPFINKDSITVDSVYLSLNYTKLYGDSNSVENMRVYEISQNSEFLDSLYPVSHPDFAILPALLGEKTINFTTLNDPQTIKKGSDTGLALESNILRVRLNNAFGTRLVNYDTTNAYKSDSAFVQSFKGFAVLVDSTGSTRKKALAYFNLTDNTKTRLTVYYRTIKAGIRDTAYTEFVYKNQVAKSANLVKRTITGSNYARNATGAINQDKLYIQSSPGSFVKMSIPALTNLSNRLIYKAELIVEKLPSLEDNYFTAPVLFADIWDFDNKRYYSIPTDFSTDYAGTYNYADFGGIINAKTNRYIFNFTRAIQGMLTRKQTVYSVFRLYAPFSTWPTYLPLVFGNGSPIHVNGSIGAGRVVVGGGGHPTQKLRLRIIYSKI